MVHDEKTMQLRLIGIHALEGVVTSELFQQLDFDEQAHLIIPTLLFALMDSRAEPYALHDMCVTVQIRKSIVTHD